MNYEIVFESDRILYVRIDEKLIEDYLKMYNDENIQKLLFKKVYEKEKIYNWIKKIIEEDSYRYSMIDKDSNEFVGNIEIISNEEKIAEIMISITPTKQGNHYATEAIKSIIEYGYDKLGIKGYDLNVYKNNLKAIHLYKNVGFVEDDKNISDESIHMSMKR